MENDKTLENAEVVVYNNYRSALYYEEENGIEGIHDEKGKVYIYI